MIRSRHRILRAAPVVAAAALSAIGVRMRPAPVRAQGLSVPLPAARPQPKLSALEALRRGDYERAIEAGRADLAAAPQSLPALSLVVRALLETGARGEAEEAARTFISRNPKAPDAWSILGDVLVTRGRRPDAEAAYLRAIAGRGPAALAAEASLGILLHDRGLRAEADARFERLIAAYNAGRATSAQDLIAVGRACRYVGASNPAAFKDALKAFDEAEALDETH